MNNVLKKEIIKHIFNVIGITKVIGSSCLIEPLTGEKFLLDKKLVFETDENKKYENNIFAAKAEIENSNIKVMIADTSEEIWEFTILLQMDNFTCSALRLSSEADDFGSIYFDITSQWIDVNTSAQAKLLVGVESLSEIFVEWEKLEDYVEMHKKLIDFLNFYEKV